jgi:hypothetical protein
MKRWLGVALICLIIGAIVNVVLAWWITVADTSRWTFGGHYGPPDQAQSEWWLRNVPAEFPFAVEFVISKPMRGVWTEVLSDQDLLPTGTDAEERKPLFVERRRAGWPFKSLEGQKWFSSSDHRLNQSHGAWPLFDTKPWLPLRPMWPGFLANSVLFGLVPFLPIAAFAAARRSRRRRRHQCLHCGYPVGTSPVCTECGRAMAQPPVR